MQLGRRSRLDLCLAYSRGLPWITQVWELIDLNDLWHHVYVVYIQLKVHSLG